MGASESRLGKVTTRPKLADEIAASLRQAILQGVYEQDAKLGMEELAEELGVSIMPVREALITLSNEGLVATEPRRGFRANPLSKTDIDDVFEIQAHLAGILASRAAQQATAEDIAILRGYQEEIVAASARPASPERTEELDQLNSAFHRHINKIPSGDRLRWFLRLTNRFVRHDLFESAPGATAGTLNDHPLIVDAIENRDSDEARRLTEAHFLRGSNLVSGAQAPAAE